MGSAIITLAAVAGAAVYYLQVYAFYEPVAADAPDARVQLTSITSGEPETILTADYQGIDASSSPLRYRACFTVRNSIAMLTETYVVADDAVPLVAPGWFDCFDADQIGEALESEAAFAFLGQSEIADGVDRVVAVFPDGRGFAWHQLNDEYKD